MKMMLAATALGAALVAVPASAEPIVVDPTSDGSLYVCPGCNVVSDDAYVLVAGYIQGAIKFSSAPITAPIGQAFLTLNPYALPLFGPSIDIYGYGTSEGQLVESDADAGVYIGTLLLPPNLGFGQDAFFDVTSFLMTVNAPFIAFNLRSEGTDVFSSLEYNYGHPSQLLITLASAVPEPATWTLVAACGLLLLAMRRSRYAAQR
jgi:hypothetical protein